MISWNEIGVGPHCTSSRCHYDPLWPYVFYCFFLTTCLESGFFWINLNHQNWISSSNDFFSHVQVPCLSTSSVDKSVVSKTFGLSFYPPIWGNDPVLTCLYLYVSNGLNFNRLVTQMEAPTNHLVFLEKKMQPRESGDPSKRGEENVPQIFPEPGPSKGCLF